jgi:hypothetical protein
MKLDMSHSTKLVQLSLNPYNSVKPSHP